jgi:hypothetical protein
MARTVNTGVHTHDRGPPRWLFAVGVLGRRAQVQRRSPAWKRDRGGICRSSCTCRVANHGLQRSAFDESLRLLDWWLGCGWGGAIVSNEKTCVRHAIRPDRIALARRGTRPIRDLQCPAARKPDGPRCRDLCSAPSRPDAVIPFCLPGRRVRLLCHDGERPAALDLPHACIERGQARPPRHRAA